MNCKKCQHKMGALPKDFEKMFKTLIYFKCETCDEGIYCKIPTEELKASQQAKQQEEK